MASDQDAAFVLLGNIRVDREELRRSLRESEQDTKESAARIEQHWSTASKRIARTVLRDPEASAFSKSSAREVLFGGGRGFGAGGLGHATVLRRMGDDAGRVGEGIEKLGRHTMKAGSHFSHMARIMSELVRGPLAAINPAMGSVTGALAAGARSARFFGVAMGAAVVGGIGISEIITTIIANLEKMAQVEYEAARGLEQLDADRTAGEIRKIDEEIAKLQYTIAQSLGRREATFYQWWAANFKLLAGVVRTGSFDVAKHLEQLQQQRQMLVETEKKQYRISAAVRQQYVDREIKSNQERAKSAIDLRKTMFETAKSIEESEAARAGTVLDPRRQMQYQKTLHELNLKTIIEDIAASNKLYASKKASIEENIKLNKDVEKNKAELAALEIEHANAVKENQAKIDKENIDNIKRTYEMRKDYITQAVAAEKELLNWGLKFGQISATQELLEQQKILEHLPRGTKEWRDQLSIVYETTKKIREEARGVFESLGGQAIERLKAKGRRRGTMQDIARELAKMQQEEVTALGGYMTGGRVDFDQLLRAMRNQPAFEQLRSRFGGDINAAFATAITPPESVLAGWSDTFNQIGMIVDAFIDSTGQKIAQMGYDMGARIQEAVSQHLALQLFREDRRGNLTTMTNLPNTGARMQVTL